MSADQLVGEGVVTSWNRDEGFGVVRMDRDGLEVWAHFSHVDGPPNKYRELFPGGRVRCTYEFGEQDGYQARAILVTRIDDETGPAT